MSSSGTFEQSFADNWSTELGVWRYDRFSRNLVAHLTASPATTYRDLYLYCAQHTLGSHVHIVNSTHFGNLYTTGPQEFIEKSGFISPYLQSKRSLQTLPITDFFSWEADFFPWGADFFPWEAAIFPCETAIFPWGGVLLFCVMSQDFR